MEQNTTVVKPASRMEQARVIFKANQALETPLARKDLLAKMVTEIGISSQCAATYYQNIRRELGMEQGRGVKTQVETVTTPADTKNANDGTGDYVDQAQVADAAKAAVAAAETSAETPAEPEVKAEPAKRPRKKTEPTAA